MEKEQPKKNASQRLDDLEGGMSAYYTSFNNLAADVQIVKEAVLLLGNKVDAVVKSIGRGLAVTDETISKIMVENNIETMKESVTKFIESKTLVPSESVTPTSFIVAQELDEAGIVIQPRKQFVVAILPEPLQIKMIGAKAGDLLDLEPGKLKLSIQEVYEINTPEVNQES